MTRSMDIDARGMTPSRLEALDQSGSTRLRPPPPRASVLSIVYVASYFARTVFIVAFNFRLDFEKCLTRSTNSFVSNKSA